MVEEISSEEILKEEKSEKVRPEKKWTVFLVLGIVLIVLGCALSIGAFFIPQESQEALVYPKIPSAEVDIGKEYSALTGEELGAGEAKNAPIYCIQIPNGTDGGRPQAGLTEAGIVFEAIAEAGITRFAALYQNPTSAVIGPVRSLRIYYLEWDTPFDCTIVHAGGSSDAMAAVQSYKHLSENYTYMYRGTYGARLWNNLFTTASYLKAVNADWNLGESNPKEIARLTPEESEKTRIDELIKTPLKITQATSENTSVLAAKVDALDLRFGGLASFNVHYDYDLETNTYRRSYASGAEHTVYECPSEDLGEKNPEDVCSLTVMAPRVVVAMMVAEKKAWDNYHEDITTTGSGEAYIFQNGVAIKGTWKKDTREDQLRFIDAEGEEIKLAPGQTLISAIPNYGSVDF